MARPTLATLYNLPLKLFGFYNSSLSATCLPLPDKPDTQFHTPSCMKAALLQAKKKAQVQYILQYSLNLYITDAFEETLQIH